MQVADQSTHVCHKLVSICVPFVHLLWCVRRAVGVYPDTFSQPFRYDHAALKQAAPQSVPLTAQPAALGALVLWKTRFCGQFGV